MLLTQRGGGETGDSTGFFGTFLVRQTKPSSSTKAAELPDTFTFNLKALVRPYFFFLITKTISKPAASNTKVLGSGINSGVVGPPIPATSALVKA
jgi:hypothetical protein